MHAKSLSLAISTEWVGLAAFLVVCFAAAALGSLATRPEISKWYVGVAKPSWTPPNWLFGPVWTLLYAAMAVAGWLVWRRADWQTVWIPLSLFLIQLILNTIWSFIFFKSHQMGWAFADIAVLWVAIGLTMWRFADVSMVSALLLLPYLVWISYAGALNFTIWRMNKQPAG